MTRARSLAVLVVVALALALGACGGKKRPPAVTADPGRPGAPVTSATPAPDEPMPVESGPDVQAVGEDAARAEDFSVSDPSGEGGPLEDVHFDYDSAALTDTARAILERHAAWIQANRAAKITIEGHCDERGTVDYNLALGDQRARAVREYLVSLGVAAERLITVSFGKERPLDPASSEAAWAKNRRAHFVVAR